MNTTHGGRGGARPGSGPRVLYAGKSETLTARIRPASLEKLKAVATLRELSLSDALELVIDWCARATLNGATPTALPNLGWGDENEPAGDGTLMRGIDAAAMVLRDAPPEGMSAKDIVANMLARGLWQSQGQTPDATIGSLIYVDMDKQGARSRFVKKARGRFALRA